MAENLLPRTFKGYEEVHVPPAPALPPPAEDELVKISELEDWAQLAFKVIIYFKNISRIPVHDLLIHFVILYLCISVWKDCYDNAP